MVFILQLIAIVISFVLDNAMAKFVACILPAIYIVAIAPAVFALGAEISINKLEEILSKEWINYEELAQYIKKYWCALEYFPSAGARQRNCVILSITSIGLSAYYFLKLKLIFPTVILAISGIILYAMAMRANRPLSIFNDNSIRNYFDKNKKLSDEWRLAATSLVAISEIFPESERHKHLAEIVMQDEFARLIVQNWKRG